MIDRILAEVGRDNYGVIPAGVLRELGVSRRQLAKRLDSGQLIRLHEKVLAVAGAPQTWEFFARAALEALPTAVLSHNSAAKVHNIWVPSWDAPITVCGPIGAHHELEGISVRRTRKLLTEHRSVVGGFRVTTRARTIIDLAATTGDARLKRLVEDELFYGRTTWHELERTFVTTAKRGRKGIGRARRVLEKLNGEPPTESQLERDFVELLRAHGIDGLLAQATAPWAEREPGRVDFMSTAAKLVIELDGRKFHVRESAFERDRWRDQQALLAGYRTVRFTWRQLADDGFYVAATTQTLLETGVGAS